MTVEDQRVDHDGLGETVGRCLLCRWWHGGITRPGLAATVDACTGRTLPKVWPGGQLHQIMHNDIPAWHTTVGDVGGGQGFEVHKGWETRTGWGSKSVSHARIVEPSSPRGKWRKTADACTVWSLQSTGVGCQSPRRSTSPRCTMWSFWGNLSDAPFPYTDGWVPPACEWIVLTL